MSDHQAIKRILLSELSSGWSDGERHRRACLLAERIERALTLAHRNRGKAVKLLLTVAR
jgi:hypothetical protein